MPPHLFFYGAGLPVGLTKSTCLLLSISNMHYITQFLSHG